MRYPNFILSKIIRQKKEFIHCSYGDIQSSEFLDTDIIFMWWLE